MDGRLNDFDRESLRTGEVRWRNKAQWERKNMVIDGLLKRDSSHGVWEITDKGRKQLEEAVQTQTRV
jgi:restriction endonuclease Mrr